MNPRGPEIVPGVRVLPVRSPTLPPATHTNVWVLGHERLTLVDPATPWADEQERFDALLAPLGRVERIVLTHHHHDHHQDAARLARRHDVPILAHPATADRLPQLPIQPLPAAGFTTDAGHVRVHHTPGHAPGHVALQTAQGPVVAGDLVAGVGTIAIDPDDDGHLGTYLDSLQQLDALGATALLPAHGPVLDDPSATIAHYLAHREARSQQVLDALRAGSATPLDIARRVYAELPARFLPLAATQVRAHLIHLVERGEAVPDGPRWGLSR